MNLGLITLIFIGMRAYRLSIYGIGSVQVLTFLAFCEADTLDI